MKSWYEFDPFLVRVFSVDETTDPKQAQSFSATSNGLTSPPSPGKATPNEDETTDLAASEIRASGDPDSAFPGWEGDPHSIGRYRVIRRLGQGGFGRVYLAHDEELDRPVAVRVPNQERVLKRPEDIEAYLAEARTLARLDHPHIVSVYDVGRTDDGLALLRRLKLRRGERPGRADSKRAARVPGFGGVGGDRR